MNHSSENSMSDDQYSDFTRAIEIHTNIYIFLLVVMIVGHVHISRGDAAIALVHEIMAAWYLILTHSDRICCP